MNWAGNGSALYWVVFISAFLGVAIWESFAPRAKLRDRAERRWLANGALFAISTVIAGLILRVAPVYYAISLAGHENGLLNLLPPFTQFAAGILALDFVNYAVHRLQHAVPFLWRLHEIHHSDRDFDVSTSGRFHPLEVLMTQGAKLLAVRLLVPSPLCVLVALLLSVAENLFTHANCSLPSGVERGADFLLITPNTHRLHHSNHPRDQNRNFGQLFPWWDKLLGTWASCHDSTLVNTGVAGLAAIDTMKLRYMLLGPFQRRP
jgi:sterol desaturase/sphingolipid hydroxylase (fatty acid hydroxylase superfamily)